MTRDRGEASRWLAAGLCLSRLTAPTEDAVRRVGPWIVAAMGERLELPPAGVVADVGALLHGEPLLSRPLRAGADARLETAVRRYEDTVLGRLGTDARVAAGADAIAKLPADLRAQGVGIFVSGVLGHIAFDRGWTLQPGVVRAAMHRPAREIVERGFSALRDSAPTRAALADGYEALVRGSQTARQLVSDADLFALENLEVLRTLTQRLAIAQVVEAREELARALPPRIRSTRAGSGSTATSLDDESEYPVGGYSSISTSGTLENLVTSELIYMDPPGSGAAPAAVDLFDMRYAEGELLYYTRDEAIFRRRRRVVTFLLGDDLAATRVKDAALPWQRIVLLFGLVMTVIKKLSDDLGGEGLRFRVVFVRESPEQPSALRGERDLCELALREWRDRGMAEVLEGTLDAEAAHLASAARGALVEVVVCSTGEAAHARWSAAAAAKRLDPRTTCVPFATGLGQAADLDGWREATTDLVASLL
jgi:hypothetical protein